LKKLYKKKRDQNEKEKRSKSSVFVFGFHAHDECGDYRSYTGICGGGGSGSH